MKNRHDVQIIDNIDLCLQLKICETTFLKKFYKKRRNANILIMVESKL